MLNPIVPVGLLLVGPPLMIAGGGTDGESKVGSDGTAMQ
ncbi:hypothetical protein FG91_02205 [Sphingopyxis sp. LC81]|nr:hypothetical protein FG91_02205 [Sphingopyxis sp. LC81]